MKNIIRFALLLVLLFVSTANSQVIVVNPIQDAEFNTEIAVTAGAGTWSYEFLLTPASTPTSDDEEWIRVDFVNANVDFTFTLGHLENENPHEDAVAPRKQSLKFLSLKLSNDKVVTTTGKYELDVGVVLRWRYRPSNVAVSQSSLMFAGYREFRYFDFEHGTELDADTSTIAQSFGRDELMPGDNIIGIFGGEAVQVPDDDDPRYNKFGTSYELEVAQNGKYVYQLSGKQFFDFEIINPSYAFSHTITRSNTNPTSSQVPTGLTALHYFSLDITSAQQPGPTGLRYGAVLRFRYPDGIASNIDQTTLNFMYHDGTKWSTFSQKAERSVYTKYLSQSTNEFLELKKLKMDFALVADVSGAPVEPSTPVVEQSSGSPITQPSTPTDGQESNPVESLPVEQRESSDAVSSGQVKFFIALIALVIAVAL